MVDQRRKMQREIAKERAEARQTAEAEKDTIYFLVFEPRTDVPVPPKGEDWSVRLLLNPHNHPEVIERAILIFEKKFNLKSWQEVAIRYQTDSLYYP